MVAKPWPAAIAAYILLRKMSVFLLCKKTKLPCFALRAKIVPLAPEFITL